MSESDHCTSQMFLKTFSPRVLLLNVSEERMRLRNQHFFFKSCDLCGSESQVI